MISKKLDYHYDAGFDVLYISVDPNEPAMGYEESEGILIRRSIETGDFVGITIFDFRARLAGNDFPGVFDYVGNDFLSKINIDIGNNVN